MAAEAAETAGHLFPQRTTLTKVFLGIAFFGASGAVAWRYSQKSITPVAGWCADGLNIFTILAICTIIYAAFDGDQGLLDATVRENIGLIMWSLLYCAVMLGKNFVGTLPWPGRKSGTGENP